MDRTRYLRIMQWARNRYNYCTRGGCAVVVDTRGIATRYTVIEALAAEKYMGCSTRTRSRRLTFPRLFDAPTADQR